MKVDAWQQARQIIGDERLELGPQFAQQALYSPRHILFVLARYKFATRLLPRRPTSVLELGCGEGFGATLLTEDGHTYVGVDSDQPAIAHAKHTLGRPDRSFVVGNILDLSGNRQFGAVVSLDVIEHIPAREEEAFLDTAIDNLREDGICIIGTPNATASAYASPQSQVGHINLYTAERLDQLMSQHFTNVFLFGMNDEVAHTGFYAMSHYLFAVGCGPRW